MAEVQKTAAEAQGIVSYEILKEDRRDVYGISLHPGTKVVRVGDVIVSQSAGCYTAKPYQAALRQRAFSPRVPSDIVKWRNDFTAKIEDNFSIARMKMSLFPEMASWNAFRIVGGRRIWHSDVVADFTDGLQKAIVADMINGVGNMDLSPELAGVSGMVPPPGWMDETRIAFVGKIYEVRGFLPGRCAYAVEAFVTRWAFDMERGFAPARATAREIQRVIECAEAALPQLKDGRKLVFYAIGTGLSAGEGFEASLAGHRVVTVSAQSVDGKWSVRTASNLAMRMPFRDFCDRLMPLTRNELVSAVKTCVDAVVRAGMIGKTMPVEGIVDDLQRRKDLPYGEFPRFRRTAVTRALLQLQGHDPAAYAVCRGKSAGTGAVVMSPSDVQPGDRRFRGRSRLVNFLIHNLLRLLAAVVCIGLLACKMIYLKNVPLWMTCCAMVATWLVGSWLQDKIIALSEIEKE